MQLVTTNGPTPALLTLKSGGQLTTDRYGLSSARAVWWYYGTDPESQVGLFSQHPRWAFLYLDKRYILRNDDGSWEISGDYFGVIDSPNPIYSFDLNSTQEPIQTHPNFYLFAGNVNAPNTANGAKFDSTGLFLGFLPVPGATPPSNQQWVGVDAYVTYSGVWRATGVTTSLGVAADLDTVGTIEAPDGNPPTPSGRNWLYAGPSFDQKGLTYTYRKEWLLSGPLGWNTTMYGGNS